MAKYIFERKCKINKKEYKIGDEVPVKGISAKDFQFLKTTGTIKSVAEKKEDKDLEQLNKALDTSLKKIEQENKALTEKITALEETNKVLLEENEELKKNSKAE